MQSGLKQEAVLRKVASTQFLLRRTNRSEAQGLRTGIKDTSSRREYSRPAGEETAGLDEKLGSPARTRAGDARRGHQTEGLNTPGARLQAAPELSSPHNHGKGWSPQGHTSPLRRLYAIQRRNPTHWQRAQLPRQPKLFRCL